MFAVFQDMVRTVAEKKTFRQHGTFCPDLLGGSIEGMPQIVYL